MADEAARKPLGRLLGIDHGLKRIGLAVSDETGLIARELVILKRKTNADDFSRLNNIAAEQKVVAFVVGIPNSYQAMPGTITQADKVRSWIERFAETTTLPFILWDEQLTSVDARELAYQKRRKQSDPIDDLAARLILQSYLDALRDGLASPPK